MRDLKTETRGQAPTLAEATTERLRAMILSGELASGTRLQEKTFAERLGVSRTPVREAIARLVTEGLVTRSQGGVPTVHRISITEIIEILHLRRLLECEAARQAAQVNSPAEPWLELRRVITGFTEGNPPDAEQHMGTDHALHMLIARTAGSQLLLEYIENLKTKTRMFDSGSIPDRLLPGCHEHMAIIDAIVARKPEEAEAAMRAHIENAREAILRHIHRLS